MDFLDENFGAQTPPLDLNELVVAPTIAAPPKGAIRNRSATAALLTAEPAKAVENYQLLLKEGEEGNSAVYDQLKGSILDNTAKVDMQGVMSALSDKSIPFETKQRAIASIRGSQFLKDSGTILHSNSLAAGSKGENPYNENARLSTSDLIREIYDARVAKQGLVNAHAATLDSASLDTVGEMIGLDVIPLGTAMSTEGVQSAYKKNTGQTASVWDVLKAYILPGSAKMDMIEHLKSFPPAKQEAMNKAMLAAIDSNSGIIFPADNHFAEARNMQQVFSEGGYTSTDKWIDNLANVADIVGLGWFVRGAGATKAAKGATAASETATGTGAFRPGSRPQEASDAAFRMNGSTDVAVKGPEFTEVTKITGTEVGPYTGPKVLGPAQPELANPQLRLDMADEIKRIDVNSVIRLENPSSPANIIQQSNPEKARSIHEMVARAEGDDVAEAFYGVSKTQAIINDIFPQAATESGRITSKVVDIDRNLKKELNIDEDIATLVHDTGAIYYSRGEKAQARAKVVNDFGSAEGLVPHDAEASFTVQGGRIRIDAVYGTPEGGFLTADDAFTQAKFALRNSGVRDEDITLLVKQGLDYAPTTLAEAAGKEGSYKVRIGTFHEIDPTDVSTFDLTTTKRNWTDSMPVTTSQNTGSLARWIMDAASMVDPKYSGAATVATDATSKFEKVMLQLATEYSDKVLKLDKKAQGRINDYIREANYNGIAFDVPNLIGRGMSTEDISALQSWRKFWDHHFYLENYDIVKTLNAQGYMKFKNANTELYARPIAKNQNIGWFYDPSVDDVVRWGQGEGDVLYAAGGTYAKLRRPTTFNGVEVEHMIIRNTPTEYASKLRDTDTVLNYRDGYFQLQYKKNARFVDQIVRDINGVETGRKTIAVANDTAEAMAFAKRMAGNSGNSVLDYFVRGDVNGLRRGGDEWWDLNSASGRISQRHRGQLLEDSSGLNHLGDGSYVQNPIDSAVRAAKSISGRTVNRPMLEAAKARYTNMHQNVLPKNTYGEAVFPSKIGEITSKGETTSKAVRDARTDYEYINYLQNGYINNMDEFFKQSFNAMAQTVATIGKRAPDSLTKPIAATERGLLGASDVSVSGTLKGGVFTATIASNVLRQWIMQPHQILRTLSYNPIGWANGGIPHLLMGYTTGKMGFVSQGLATAPIFATTRALKNPKLVVSDFIYFMDKSGLLDSVDKSNLVRGTLLTAADSGNALTQKIAKYTTTPARVAGFDLGEMANLLGHSAAVYEKRTRLGGNMKDLVQRDEAYSEIRAISGEMNFAGDMPYNQTTPALITQFAQVPHKMTLQLTNRRIGVGDRLRMAAGDIILWGSPAAAIGAMLGKDVLPDDPFTREAFVWGLESAITNHSLSKITGRDVNIDFSAYVPGGLDGWVKMFHSLMTGGVQKTIINSPAGQLFLKDGGRGQNAMSHVARFFNFQPEIDETPETAGQVLKEVANMMSGISNYNKMMQILETGKLVDKSGRIVADDLGTPEAIYQLFGFAPASQRDMFNSIMELQKDPKKHKEAVLKDYAAVVQYYTSQGMDNQDQAWMDKVTGSVLRMYKDDPVALGIIQSQLARDLADPENAISKLFLKRIALGFPTIAGTKDMIHNAPVSEAEKENMRRVLKDLEDALANDKQGDN